MQRCSRLRKRQGQDLDGLAGGRSSSEVRWSEETMALGSRKEVSRQRGTLRYIMISYNFAPCGFIYHCIVEYK